MTISSRDADSPAASGAEPLPARPAPKQLADDELFFLRMLRPFSLYVPDVEALQSSPTRIVVAVGAASRGEVAARSAVALAQRLGIATTTFPGDHRGFMADPQAFASALLHALT